MSDIEFCPNCDDPQHTFTEAREGRVVTRCQVCRFPIKGMEAAGRAAERTATVLCVDDHAVDRRMFQDALEASEFRVFTAADGEAALEVARRVRPQLILLDVMLPGRDGIAICEEIRQDPNLRPVPVIILTASTDPKLTGRAFKAGADMALTKPVAPAKLVHTVRMALSLRSTRA